MQMQHLRKTLIAVENFSNTDFGVVVIFACKICIKKNLLKCLFSFLMCMLDVMFIVILALKIITEAKYIYMYIYRVFP